MDTSISTFHSHIYVILCLCLLGIDPRNPFASLHCYKLLSVIVVLIAESR